MKSETLTIFDIASWQNVEFGERKTFGIHARVPSFQRGSVWEPQQVEYLWDSIFRGFPIGSIVLVKRLESQKDKAMLAGTCKGDDKTTHHIIDGQQRCNAIALGFVDPWETGMKDENFLWLDVSPNNLPKNSTRKFLFRLTTYSHPWGYNNTNESGKISEDSRRRYFKKMDELYQHWIEGRRFYDETKRPTPKISIPYDAFFPIPVFLLFKHFEGDTVRWNELYGEPWVKLVEKYSTKSIDSVFTEQVKTIIQNGLRQATAYRIVPLVIPDSIYDESDNSIELIFQRLNNQGTPIDREELMYSMMKARWPEIEEAMDKIAKKPITDYRLVNLGLRVALYESGSFVPGDQASSENKLRAELTLDQVRVILKDRGEEYNKIKGYFVTGNEMGKALTWIDEALLYDMEKADYGLPPYLRSSIAWSSRDVFLWLLCLAKKYQYQSNLQENERKRIIGLALLVHWFGLDKAKAAKLLIESKEFSTLNVNTLKDEKGGSLIANIIPPDDLSKLMPDNNVVETCLAGWRNFWNGCIVHENGTKLPEADFESRNIKYWPFLNRLKGETEMLIYLQRDWFNKKFPDFDPSNKLMWKGHNRPWDYDHILPSNNLNAQGSAYRKYTETCKAWQTSIGNLIAADFFENRSWQDTKLASDKYPDQHLITNAFEIRLADTDDFEKSKAFVLAAKNRMVAIYGEWYDKLKIGELL